MSTVRRRLDHANRNIPIESNNIQGNYSNNNNEQKSLYMLPYVYHEEANCIYSGLHKSQFTKKHMGK